jgi:hypothetical protein
MSQNSLDDLAKQHPEYKRALRKLSAWLSENAGRRSFDAKSLAEELPNLDPAQLAGALALLVKAGVLQQAYKVITPAGVLSESEFDDPTKIPEKVADRFNNFFETSDADVVPIFKKVA